MIIDIVFFFLLSFGISFSSCMLLWLNMSFFIDGMIHSLLLASVLYSAFCIDSFLAIFLVMTLYITILTLLGKANNTNLIISSQTLTIIALVLKDDINFSRILFGTHISFTYFHIALLTIISLFIMLQRKSFAQYVLLGNVQIDQIKSYQLISVENQVIVISSLLLPILLPMGNAGTISLFIFPAILSYEISNNIYQMLISSILLIFPILLYYQTLSKYKFVIWLILFISYILIKLVKKLLFYIK